MRRFLGWSVVPAVAVLALVASGAFGASASVKSRGSLASSGSQTFTVNVDGRNKSVNESFDAYFPNDVTVHAGDTVVFDYVGVGEPHTVTLGTLANAADTAFNRLTPAQQNNPPKSALAADAKLPQLTGSSGLKVIPSAANPCFLASGVPSNATACPAVAKPAFDGRQAYYNSGWLVANEKFTVHLSSATPPGTYRFLCLIHRESMQGKITVVPSSTPVPSPAAQFALGQQQLAKDEAGLVGAAKLLAEGKPPIPGLTLPGPHPILVGSGAPGSGDPGAIDLFGPKTVHIPVGGTVTWWLAGLHSITFNSTNADNDIQTVYKNGDVQFNEQAAGPAGGPGEPPKPPTGGTPSHVNFKVVASSSWNGKGFHNSGVFGNSQPPNIEGYQIKFTRAGTYKFICTVHDYMKGTIVVGGG
jgi:plastocyanin